MAAKKYRLRSKLIGRITRIDRVVTGTAWQGTVGQTCGAWPPARVRRLLRISQAAWHRLQRIDGR
jgi:hypothetical protein